MSLPSAILLPLSLILRSISAISGFVIGLGALWFLGSTDSGASVLLEFAAGISGIAIALMPLRAIQNRFGQGICAIAVIFTVINGTIVAKGYLSGTLGVDVVQWAAANTLSVLLLSVLAWTSFGKH